VQERPSEAIQGLPGPLSEQPWSADFVMQAIEVLPVALSNRRLIALRPEHAESFIIGWPAGAKPEEVAAAALSRLGMPPVVLHSTSWRHAGQEVVLTYIAIVTPDALPESWAEDAIARAELARGDATTPPPVIGVSQVLEHALRHLAWLVKEDAGIAAALPGWQVILQSYVPEPFRPFVSGD
jgi:hypothetical protein